MPVWNLYYILLIYIMLTRGKPPQLNLWTVRGTYVKIAHLTFNPQSLRQSCAPYRKATLELSVRRNDPGMCHS